MLLIRSGEVHDGKGNVFSETDVLIDNGKIIKIGKNLKASENAKVVEAKGKFICPGFIDSLNIWGGMGPGWEDKDLAEHSNPVTPHMNVIHSFDQDGMMFQRVFEYGITAMGLTPSTSNVIGGQIGVFKTFGNHPYKMLIKESVGMRGSISKTIKAVHGKQNKMPMTRMGVVALLKNALIKAKNYDLDKEGTEYNMEHEAMKRVLNKEMPLFIHCNTKSEIEAAELALKEFDINIVFTGALGIKELKNEENKEKGIILGDLTQAMSSYSLDLEIGKIKELKKKGHLVAISCCGDETASGKESLLWNAALYHKYGFEREEILKMMTSIPAKLLNVDDKIGSIEEGKDADILIWTENPIAYFTANLEAAFIDGENTLDTKGATSCW